MSSSTPPSTCTKLQQSSQRADIKDETLRLIDKIAAFKGKLQQFQKDHLQGKAKPGTDEGNLEPDPVLNEAFDDFIELLSSKRILAYESDLPGSLELYASGLLVLNKDVCA